MFLSKILILSCMIIHYIVKEKSFPVFVYKLLEQKKLKRDIRGCFKINDKQRIIMTKKGEYVKLKNCDSKNKVTIFNLCRFWKYSSDLMDLMNIFKMLFFNHLTAIFTFLDHTIKKIVKCIFA